MAKKKLEALGYGALGLGFFFQAAKALELFGLSNGPGDGKVFDGPVNGGRQLRGLNGPEAEAMKKAGGIIQNVQTHTISNIRERVAFIQKQIKADSLKPLTRERALAVLTRKCYADDGSEVPSGPRPNMPRAPGLNAVTNGVRMHDGRRMVWCVPEKDFEAEIEALFKAVRDASSANALRYTRDHIEVDQFHSVEKLLKLKGGDCDDGTILLGSMLRSVGYPVRLRVIQSNQSSTWDHIYLLVGIPPTNPSKWIALDWSVPGKSPGWEAPGAKQVALSGKPSGLVTKLMDFAV